MQISLFRISPLALTVLVTFASSGAFGQDKPPEYPPSDKILEGYEKVVTKPNIKSMYTLWTRTKDGQMYAELPRTFAQKKYFIATTVASGENYAGLQAGDVYVYWRQYDKRLALMTPNVEIRAEGDKEAKSSVDRLFTDRVMMEVPIVTMGPGGGPIIDIDAMLISNPQSSSLAPAGINVGLASKGIYTIKTAKAFENNVEIAFEVPSSSGGALKILHYSISDIPDSTGYQPRVADSRVGFFTTTYTDLAKYNDRETRIRYVNRWFVEKADPKLQVSPPKNPIVFYIEHTTPVRYRRWVRDGVMAWNAAFEKIGIANAIEVYYQDATTKAHMDKDPEDVQYNFVRWLNNNIGTAIGPSRVHPLTGQILDADIILTDGWIRHYQKQFAESLPKVAMEGYGPDTLAWLAEHPNWDPRIRLAPPSMRNVISEKIAMRAAMPFAGHPMAAPDNHMMGDQEFDGLNRSSQVNGMCLAAEGMSFDLAIMKMTLELLAAQETPAAEGEKKEEKKDEKKEEPKEQMLDGMPESFVGPLIAHLVAHEVGHTLGLRHNFKASSVYTLAQINSDEVKGKKPMAGSVMDYIGTNIRLDSGALQGDYCMSGIGPYDMWAIEYGYTFGDLKPILARVAEPELAFATDEDTDGPDPLARRYDFSKNPLDFAEEQIRLASYHRARLLSEFIKDGDSWDRVRYGYEMLLSLQTRSISMMSNWIGGAFVNRDKKGDPNGRKPIDVVPVDDQRKALAFVIANAFRDEAFGLTPELVTAMGLDKWSDNSSSMFEESTWPIHDRIMGIQASALTSLMNPTTLKRVYDNEFRTPADQDSLTLPEILNTISAGVWSELDAKAEGAYTARKPLISSLRRNLQREHLERLIDLTLPGNAQGAAGQTISTLASEQLRQIVKKIEAAQAASADKHDAYTTAHLAQAKDRITKALDANYILNPGRNSGGSGIRFILGRETEQTP